MLERIAESPSPVGVSELARALGTGRGTVHQQLSTLVAAGWVEQTAEGRYWLTLRATRLGYRALEQANLGERIRPSVEALAAATGEAVSLAVLDQGEALIVQRVESDRILRVDLGVGVRMPLATSASGRALAAFSPPDLLEDLRRQGVALPAADVLENARERGFAVSIDEYLDGIFAVAAPVFEMSNKLLAAISVAGISSKFDEASAVTHIRAAVSQINGILGGRTAGGAGPHTYPRVNSEAVASLSLG